VNTVQKNRGKRKGEGRRQMRSARSEAPRATRQKNSDRKNWLPGTPKSDRGAIRRTIKKSRGRKNSRENRGVGEAVKNRVAGKKPNQSFKKKIAAVGASPKGEGTIRDRKGGDKRHPKKTCIVVILREKKKTLHARKRPKKKKERPRVNRNNGKRTQGKP